MLVNSQDLSPARGLNFFSAEPVLGPEPVFTSADPEITHEPHLHSAIPSILLEDEDREMEVESSDCE